MLTKMINYIFKNVELNLHLLGFPVNTGQRAGMPSTQAVRGQIGGSIHTTQHGER